MDIAVSNKVFARNSMGQFIAECEAAGTRVVEHAVEEGAKLSRSFAPVGSRPDLRSIPLRESIASQMTGARTGHWFSASRHALPVEFGAGPHTIVGHPFLKFYWESAGRWWIPGLFGAPDVVNHPGNPAQPFLRPAYEIVMANVMRWARRYYPG